jgi:Reverse transcriptase (RNA-dependent DNA polymerase)
LVAKGNVERYKTWLVAKDFTQKEGKDYNETFSPVSTKDSFRIIMALVAHLDLELYQMDVKTAFLNGKLDEIIYIVQLSHFEMKDPKDMVCQLKKSIYGLKQASWQWYFKFAQVIVSFGFETNQIDECIYHKFSKSKVMFLVLYVDDLLLVTNNMNKLRETKKILYRFFEMKDLGEASYVLGLKIHRVHSQGILQQVYIVYIDKVLKRYGMEQCKSGDTQVTKGDKFSLNQCPRTEFEKSEMQNILYA